MVARRSGDQSTVLFFCACPFFPLPDWHCDAVGADGLTEQRAHFGWSADGEVSGLGAECRDEIDGRAGVAIGTAPLARDLDCEVQLVQADHLFARASRVVLDPPTWIDLEIAAATAILEHGGQQCDFLVGFGRRTLLCPLVEVAVNVLRLNRCRGHLPEDFDQWDLLAVVVLFECRRRLAKLTVERQAVLPREVAFEKCFDGARLDSIAVECLRAFDRLLADLSDRFFVVRWRG